MEIKYTKKFEYKYEKLKKKDSLIKKRIDRKLKLLTTNPRQPSLRLHKINSQYESWSISIDMDLRILFVYRKYGILLIDIGGHDEVY